MRSLRVMKTNKFLEKIALNAAKAREMAKAVGVIPDHLTQWKYALRNLRNSSGNPLSGEALEQARVRLGALSSDGFKKVEQASLANDGFEVGFNVGKDGNIKGRILGGDNQNKLVYSTKDLPNTEALRMGHTHGIYENFPQKFINPRQALPSGIESHLFPFKPKSNRDMRGDLSLVDSVVENIQSGALSPEQGMRTLDRNLKTVVGYIDDTGIPQGLAPGGESRDVANVLFTPQVRHANNTVISLNNIVTPEIGVDAVHRVVGGQTMTENKFLHALKHRTVFFSHEKSASLEKVALNALKARRMAEQVGIIPNHLSQWKWGLRQLRDGRGSPLSGKVLEQAKINLGGLSKDGYSKIKKIHDANSGKEIGFSVKPSGDIGKKVAVGSEDKIKVSVKDFPNTEELRFGHTHGLHSGIKKEQMNSSLAFPSGLQDSLPFRPKGHGQVMHDAKVYDDLLSHIGKGIISSNTAENLLKRHTKTIAGGVYKGRIDPIDTLGRGKDLAASIYNPQSIHKDFIRRNTSNIVTPELGVEGVHKVTGVQTKKNDLLHVLKHRTIFLNHAE